MLGIASPSTSKNLGGVIIRVPPTDANNIATTGTYIISNTTQNVPYGWGSLVHIENTYALQMYFGGTNTNYDGYVRSRLGDGSWRPWNAITLTAQV